MDGYVVIRHLVLVDAYLKRAGRNVTLRCRTIADRLAGVLAGKEPCGLRPCCAGETDEHTLTQPAPQSLKAVHVRRAERS
jgi:hypothetical protein